MRHLGLEIHRLEKMMARRRGYSAAHQDADRLTGMHGYLIRYLYENRGRDVFQREIAKAGSLSRSPVPGPVQRLTQKAVDLHRQIEEDIAGFEEMLAQGIPDEDQETFLRVAQKMRENLGDDISQKWTCKGGHSE